MTWALLALWFATLAGGVIYVVVTRRATQKPVDKAIVEVTQAVSQDDLLSAFTQAKDKEEKQDILNKSEGDDAVGDDLSKRGYR